MAENENVGHATDFEEHFPEAWMEEIDLGKVSVPKRVMWTAGVILGLLIAGPILIFGYDKIFPAKSNAIPEQLVQVMKVRYRHMYHTVTIPAGIRSFRSSVIYAHVPGYLKVLNVDKGDYVHKGQILAYIQDPELRESLNEKEARVRINFLTYERIKKVWLDHPRLISKQRVQEKLAAYLASISAMRHDEALVAYKTILAPYDGMITHRFVDQGKLISQGTEQTVSVQPIVTIEQIDTLRAYVWVPAGVAPHIRRGQRVEAQFEGLPDETFEGRVTRFDVEENPKTRTMRTEVDFDNHDLRIHPGMYGKYTFYIKELPQALLIPGGSVRSEKGKGLSVAVVDKNGQVEIRPITVGIDNGNWVQVINGLEAGDRVVTAGKWHVKNGQVVRAIPIKIIPFRPARQM